MKRFWMVVLLAGSSIVCIWAIDPQTIDMRYCMSSSYVLKRADPFSAGFFPNGISSTWLPFENVDMGFDWHADTSALSLEFSINQSVPADLRLILREAMILLFPIPEFELSGGFGSRERGEGTQRALFDVIGSGKPYFTLGLTWILSSDLSVFLATDITTISKLGIEIGGEWSAGIVHMLGGLSRLGSGLITGGVAVSVDVFGGIWIGELGVQTGSPALYPQGSSLVGRSSALHSFGRLSTLYSRALGDGTLLLNGSITWREAAYTPDELTAVMSRIERLQADGTLADLARIACVGSVGWESAEGVAISVMGMLNPLDLSLGLQLGVSVPIGEGELAFEVFATGGEEATDEYRLYPPLSATISYRLFL